jgi:hypothetical protein
MGRRIVAGFRRPQELLYKTYNIDKPFAGGSTVALFGSITSSGKCRFGRRKRMWKQDEVVPNLFCIRSIVRGEAQLLRTRKIAYTVVMASRKMKHYFQAHHIRVSSAQPLEALFWNSEAIGQIGKCAAELNEYTVDFEHRSAIKS